MGSGVAEVCFLCLLIAHQFFTGRSNAATASNSSATLSLTAVDQREENGLIVKRIDDNLTLSCSLVDGDDAAPPSESVRFNWTLPFQESNRTRTIAAEGNALRLTIESLQPSDAGQYSCVAPQISGLIAHAYVAVRPASPLNVPYCSASMFTCGDGDLEKSGAKCVPRAYLCDGRADCPTALDEAPDTCGSPDPCSDKLRCGDGRCIPKNWCCRGRKNCLPHPCCAEHMHDEFPLEKTGGGLRSDPDERVLLRATLYKACACLLAVAITFAVLISAICRARLKRISSSGRGRVEAASPDSLNGRGLDCVGASPSLRDCRYSLVCRDDNFAQRNRSAGYPPSYSEADGRSSGDNVPNSSPSARMRTGVSESESDDDRPTENERENSDAANYSPIRRPNDFGIGLVANAIFNSRYRPVPRRNVEISSLDYVTDSDSSVRTPAARSADDPIDSRTVEFNSHFYGERVGGPVDVDTLRGLPESRRLRHANALDRILDRFGLNAPYDVDIDRQYNRSAWEFRTFSTPDRDDPTPRRSGRFLSSFWTRFKDRFRRNHRIDGPDGGSTSPNSFISNAANNNLNINRRRRRPDTPDVPELTFGDRNSRRLVGLLDGDANATFAEISYFGRDCYVTRDVRLVSSHNFPPPYSQFALDPPPPYVSRENLISADPNTAIDPNGNTISDNMSSGDSAIILNVELSNNGIGGGEAVSDANMSNSAVAFNTCDANGNVEQNNESTMEPQHLVNVVNNNCEAFNSCIMCSGIIKCSKHRVASGRPSIPEQIGAEGNLSTSTTSLINETEMRYNSDNNNSVVLLDKSSNVRRDLAPSSSTVVECETDVNSNTRVDCQNYLSDRRRLSVPSEVLINIQSSTRTTEECGLIFPPNNLEFIDSDVNLDHNL